MKLLRMPNEFSAVYQLSCLIYWINMTYHLRHLLQHHFGHPCSPDLDEWHSLEAAASEVLEQQEQHIHLMDHEAIPIKYNSNHHQQKQPIQNHNQNHF